MKSFSASELNIILQDILLSPVPSEVVINAINTDTRTLKKGETFVAIAGDSFDGHAFIENAEKLGANNIIAERSQNAIQINQVLVTNTRLALAKLATQIRKFFKGKVVGLTGSVGKTTSKQMLTSICSQVGKTHATKGNFNNALGVPFTWFDVPEDADFAIIEMGAKHQGEIAFLSAITRPEVAMITNAGEAHLQGFGGLDGVAKGKGELFAGLTENDTAILNLDDKYHHYWRGLLGKKVDLLTFSLGNDKADVFADSISFDGASFILCFQESNQALALPTTGLHNVMNALGCATCALSLGIKLCDIAKGLANFEGALGRLQRHQFGQVTIIDDTYNANPVSMRASAEILQKVAGYRVMVIADMEELGSDEMLMHAQLGGDLAAKADLFFCLGEKMTAFAKKNHKAQHFAKIDGLNKALLEVVKNQDLVTVLVKGSRSMKMERVIKYLLDKFA